MDKGTRVCGKRKKISCASSQSQTEWTVLATLDAGTQQIGEGKATRNIGKPKQRVSGPTTVSKRKYLVQ